MKSAWTVVAAGTLSVLVATVAGPARHAHAQARTSPATRPTLIFEQDTIDMGPVSDGEPLVRPFTFTNASNRTVTVATSHCHFCIPPILSATRVAPGEKATVVLEIDGAGRRGSLQASATVAAAGVPGSEVNLTLKAEIFPRLWVEPSTTFPRVVRGRGGSSVLTVIGRGSGFKVAAVDTGSPLVSADVGPREKAMDQGAECYKQALTLRFSPDAPLGPLATTLRVKAADADVPVRDVSVQAQVVGLVEVRPATVGGEVAVGTGFDHTFELVCEDPLGMDVLSVDVPDPEECRGVVTDLRPTADPARWVGRVAGTAPGRPRSSVEVPVELVTRVRSTGEVETVRLPVVLYVPRPKDDPTVP